MNHPYITLVLCGLKAFMFKFYRRKVYSKNTEPKYFEQINQYFASDNKENQEQTSCEHSETLNNKKCLHIFIFYS